MVPNRRPGGEGQFVKRTHVVFDEDDDSSASDSEYQELVSSNSLSFIPVEISHRTNSHLFVTLINFDFGKQPLASSKNGKESEPSSSSTQTVPKESNNDIVNDPNVSHLDYLKSKMKKLDIEKLEAENENENEKSEVSGEEVLQFY
jgi:hypothetical protein